MNAFDVYAAADHLANRVEQLGDRVWATEIRESMLRGATSGEILGDLRLTLQAYARSAQVKAVLTRDVDALVAEIDALFR